MASSRLVWVPLCLALVWLVWVCLWLVRPTVLIWLAWSRRPLPSRLRQVPPAAILLPPIPLISLGGVSGPVMVHSRAGGKSLRTVRRWGSSLVSSVEIRSSWQVSLPATLTRRYYVWKSLLLWPLRPEPLYRVIILYSLLRVSVTPLFTQIRFPLVSPPLRRHLPLVRRRAVMARLGRLEQLNLGYPLP